MATQPSTTNFVEIADIQGSLVLLKDGSLRSLIGVESVNFDLKSNDEQIGIIRGFQDFLNALDFPLQIVINSRRLNLTPYLAMLETAKSPLANELLRMQMDEYTKFIKGLSELAHIMSKTFFVSIPYYSVEDVKDTGKGIGGKIKSIFSSGHHMRKLAEADVQKYQPQIEQRVAIVMSGLTPLGMKAHLLGQEELLNLFYAYYNPGQLLSS